MIVIREVWKLAQDKDAKGEWIFGEEAHGDPICFRNADKDAADQQVAASIASIKEKGPLYLWNEGTCADLFVRIEMVTIPFAEWKEKYNNWDYGGMVGIIDWCEEHDWHGEEE